MSSVTTTRDGDQYVKIVTVSPTVKAVAGSLGGVVEACMLQPIDVMKTRLQLDHSGHYKGMVHCGRTIAKEEGIKSLWKGLTPFVGQLTLKYALRMGSNAFFLELMRDQDGKLSQGARLGAGLGAGVSEALLVVTPFEVVKTRMQQQKGTDKALLKYRGPVHTAMTVAREEGVMKLWSGATATTIRQGSNQMSLFWGKSVCDGLFYGKYEGDGKLLSPAQSAASGFVAACIGPILNNPFDVVKTRMQAANKGGPQYTGFMHCLKSIASNEGMLALWKGLVPRLARTPPGQAIVWSVSDQITGYFERQRRAQCSAPPLVENLRFTPPLNRPARQQLWEFGFVDDGIKQSSLDSAQLGATSVARRQSPPSLAAAHHLAAARVRPFQAMSFFDVKAASGRFEGVTRPYTEQDVQRLRGSVKVEYTLAQRGADQLWELLKSEDYVHALGALSGNQAVQMAKAGLKAIYLSGWQVAAETNTAGSTYPDQSLYPVNSVPELVKRINNALQRADQIEFAEGKVTRDYFLPIVADAEAGFGGPLNAHELTKHLVHAGAAGVHFEDQLSSEKKCGHLGGKVLVPTQSAVRNLIAARLAADVAGTPTVIIARTDAHSANLLTSDIDDSDKPFCTGKRTPEGFYYINCGVKLAIARGLAYAPYADLIWCETSTPDMEDAREFAEGIHAQFPGKMLAYNCSPSFNWERNLSKEQIATFQQELGKMGYKFQFVTLAGYHALNYSMFDLASGYRERGMAAYSELQQREFAREKDGYTCVKHQREAGTGYFDAVSEIVSGGQSSTGALKGSTEASHRNKTDTTDGLHRVTAQRSCWHRVAPSRAAAAARRQPRHQAVLAAAGGGTDALHLFSPSKINVFLRIMRRREDGFHDLASLFHVIDLGDDMSFEELAGTASADVLTCNMDGVPTDDSNLVIKALNLFRTKTGRSQRFKIDLAKRVPHGAGLGGGSGNAATTLWAANELCGRPASVEELLLWSGEIGSDISVFFSNGAAYCTGRGEVVENVPPPLPLNTPLLLVKPPVGLSTPEIFKALDLDRRSTADPRQLLARLAAEGATQELTVNDLEQPAFDRLPELLQLKQQLQAEGSCYSSVFMTGSGSTIVCVGSDSIPSFLSDARYTGMFVSPARFITRQRGEWFAGPSQKAAPQAPTAVVA
ncbi:Isocitrate lyase [Chlorella vulgaris]